MKQLPFLLLIILALIFSCDKIDDANTIGFNTSISMNMPVTVASTNVIELKSARAYPFSETAKAYLSQDADIEDYLDKIKSVTIENVEVIFNGLKSDQEITTITLSIANVGEIATLTNITSSNTTHNPTVSGSLLTKVANELENNWMISATVNGIANEAPMWFNISVTYDLRIEAEAL